MSAHAYNENQLVARPAIGLFAELCWQVALPHPHAGPLPGGERVAGPPPAAGAAGEPLDVGLLKPEYKTTEQDSSGSRSGSSGTRASGLFGDVPGPKPLWAFGWRAYGVPEPGT